MRWLARPTRCSSRATPLGAPTCTTWSTLPQSMPRSSEAVATTARSRPDAIAASTLRRCSTVRLPWCSAIGRLSSFKRHSACEAQLRLGAGVDEDDGDAAPRRMRRYTSGMEARPICPPQGRCPSGSMMESSGAAPPRTCTSCTSPGTPLGDRKARSGSGCATVAESPTRRAAGARVREARQAERELVAALGAGEGVDLVHHRRAEPAEHGARLRQRQQQRQAFRRGQQQVGRRRALPGAAVLRRVAGARLDADGQAHLRRPARAGSARCPPPAP